MHIKNKGFTLIELMITVVIIAVAVALAVPSFDRVRQKRQTTSAAEQVAAFISNAQSEAVKRNEEVTVSITRTNNTTWCLGAIVGTTACDCTETVTTETDYCDIEDVAQILNSTEWPLAQVTASGVSADNVFTFDPVRGIMLTADLGNDHFLTVVSESGDYSLQVDVAATGRLRVCNPDSSKKVAGYDSCPGAGPIIVEGPVGPPIFGTPVEGTPEDES